MEWAVDQTQRISQVHLVKTTAAPANSIHQYWPAGAPFPALVPPVSFRLILFDQNGTLPLIRICSAVHLRALVLRADLLADL